MRLYLFLDLSEAKPNPSISLQIVYNCLRKICCSFENLDVNYFTLTALHSVDKFSEEQRILGHILLLAQEAQRQQKMKKQTDSKCLSLWHRQLKQWMFET